MAKKFDLDAYKKSIEVSDTPLKEYDIVELNDALKAVLGLKGIYLGTVNQIFGLSDSGKSSLVYHIMAQAQKQNVLPILLNTEGKISLERMQSMGVDPSNMILEQVTYLEEIFARIDRFVADIGNGDLPTNIIILVDSIGNSLSIDSVKENKDGTSEVGGALMKAARVLREKMRVFSHKINNTRKVSSKYSAGLVFVNHCYHTPSLMPGLPPTLTPYGGDGIYLASSLVVRTKKVKNLYATVGGKKMGWGIISKLHIDKNHLSNVTNSGEFIITADEIIPNEPGAIEEYKERHRDSWKDATIEVE